MARMGHALSATYTALEEFKLRGPFRLDTAAGVDERPRAAERLAWGSHIVVVDVPDIQGRNPDGSPSVNPAGDACIMTDGTGKIALNLARRIPVVYGGMLRKKDARDSAADAEDAAALIQVRVWANGCLYKGTLLVCASLPDNEIHMPKSMKKARNTSKHTQAL